MVGKKRPRPDEGNSSEEGEQQPKKNANVVDDEKRCPECKQLFTQRSTMLTHYRKKHHNLLDAQLLDQALLWQVLCHRSRKDSQANSVCADIALVARDGALNYPSPRSRMLWPLPLIFPLPFPFLFFQFITHQCLGFLY